MIRTSNRKRNLTRRTFLAAGAAAIAMPTVLRHSRAAAKALRVSTPGTPEEWQSKALEVFKTELDKSAPGVFDVQLHFNGTLFAQGTEIEAMQRGNLEVRADLAAGHHQLHPRIFDLHHGLSDARFRPSGCGL